MTTANVIWSMALNPVALVGAPGTLSALCNARDCGKINTQWIRRTLPAGAQEHRMSISKRLAKLEDEVTYRAAILDGSEAQTREGTVNLFGLLVAFLASKGQIDYLELDAFLARCVDPDLSKEDHNGEMINDLRQVIDFHRRDDAGTVEPYVPISERLSKAELAEIRTSAETSIAADASANKPKRRRRRGDASTSKRPQLH